MSFTARDVGDAIDDRLGWSEIANMDEDEPMALLINGHAMLTVRRGMSEIREGDIWVVVEIDGRFFKKTGYHQSHDGTYWDGSVSEVKPQQKTITVYERA
jgi:hypothetical protein